MRQRNVLSALPTLVLVAALCAEQALAYVDVCGREVNSTTDCLADVDVLYPARVRPPVLTRKVATSVAASLDALLVLADDGSRSEIFFAGERTTADGTVAALTLTDIGVRDERIAEIVSGHSSHFARTSDGVVYAIGRNDNGELGLGHFLAVEKFAQVSGLTNASGLACGSSHALAWGGGSLYTTGYNTDGQLGHGDGTRRNRFTHVAGGALSGKRIVGGCAGYATSFAITDEATANLYAAGWNGNGRLGVVGGSTSVFVRVTQSFDSTRVIQCWSGSSETFALTSNGEVYAVGANTDGALGLGDTSARSLFTRVTALSGLGIQGICVAQAGFSTLAWSSTGALYVWGQNSEGQLGLSSPSPHTSPTLLSTPDLGGCVVRGGAMGSGFTAVVCLDGKVFSFGKNDKGQLGHGNTTASTGPTAVDRFRDASVAGVSVSELHGFVWRSKSTLLYGFGRNTNGQLGTGNTKQQFAPVPNNEASDLFDGNIKHVETLDANTMVLTMNGSVYGSGRNVDGDLGLGDTTQRTSFTHATATIGSLTVANLSCGYGHCLAATTEGTSNLYSTGWTSTGRLGRSGSGTSFGMVSGFGGVRVAGASAGTHHSLAWTSTGILYTWGSNSNGQLGHGPGAPSSQQTPTAVAGALSGKAVVLALGLDFATLALTSDGKLYAFGDANLCGQGTLSPASYSLPVRVGGPLATQSVTLVAGKRSHALARGTDGIMYAWGFNENGQLGIGSTAHTLTPTPVAGLLANSTVAASINYIALGRYVSFLASLPSTSFYAMGSNSNGLLGTWACLPGMGSENGECRPCAAGFANNNGNGTCTACAAGTVAAHAGLRACSACPPGTYSPSPGQTACRLCGRGTYSNTSAATECTECIPGTFVSGEGNTECLPCAPGSVQSFFGKDACEVCPVGMYSPASGRSACVPCAQGTYAANTNSTECVPCSPGSFAASNSSGRCELCAPGFYGNSSGQIACSACPAGALCPRAGMRLEQIGNAEGYWRPHESSLEYFTCTRRSDACVAVSERSNGSTTCSEGTTGPTCAICADGYAAIGETCVECPRNDVAGVLLSIVILLGIAALYIIFHDTGSDEERARRKIIKVKIVIGFLQMVAQIRHIELPWPRPLVDLFAAVSVVDIDLFGMSSIDCLFGHTNAKQKFVTAVAMPPLALCAHCMWYYWVTRRGRSSNADADTFGSEHGTVFLERKRRRLWENCLITILLLYPSTTRSVLDLFRCRHIQGVSYLEADYTIECEGTLADGVINWTGPYAQVALAFLVLYGVGVPACLALLYSSEKRAHGRISEESKLFAFTEGYNAHVSWWEILKLVEKLGIVAVIVFWPGSVTELSAVLCIAVAIIAGLHLHVLPYEDLRDNNLESVAYASLFTTYYYVLLLSIGDISTTESSDFSIFIVIVGLAPIGLLGYSILFESKRFVDTVKLAPIGTTDTVSGVGDSDSATSGRSSMESPAFMHGKKPHGEAPTRDSAIYL